MLFTSFLWQMTIHLSAQKEPTVFDPHWRPVTSGLSWDAFTHNDGFRMNLKQNPARHPWRSVLTTSKLSSCLKLCSWFTESLGQSKPQALHAVGSLKTTKQLASHSSQRLGVFRDPCWEMTYMLNQGILRNSTNVRVRCQFCIFLDIYSLDKLS